ncbi:MAG: PAS domain-containing protein [Burkholderiaceae bacterium]|nr:PAS domain-containing protein [Burkholderiaceae bacterium]
MLADEAPAIGSGSQNNGPCIIAIGASAGGFDPIKQLLSTAPPNSGLAFVVIQHLDPTQKSLSAELFGRRTHMAVTEVTEGVRVEPDHVYTVPAGVEATIHNGVLHLAPPSRVRGQRMPIDHFFHSLGEDQQQKAIGVILSGTGADGALGVKSIVGNGGIVLVQRPDTAQFDGMPHAALATGLVTHVLEVEDMPAVLASYARHPYAARPEEPAPDAESQEPLLRTILELVRVKRGHDFTGYKRATLLRRIHRRMGLSYIESMGDYAAKLRKEPMEIDALFKDLFIGATEFFRDPENWLALETEVIAPLIASKRDNEPIRIWVAGASTGEEAYSVAMMIIEGLEAAGRRCPLQIFATDTSADALNVARMGIYPAGIAAQVSATRLHRFFNEVDDGRHFQVTSDLRGRVVFGLQNLFTDPPFFGVDLVSCRNVLIYLEPEVQRRVLLLLHFALRPDGYLFLGSAETLGPSDEMFKSVSKSHRIYRRVGPTPRDKLEFRAIAPEPPVPPAGFQPRPSAPQLTQAARVAQQIIFDRFAPASVLVDREFNTLYFSGPTDRFLTHPRGAPTHNLLALLREGLRSRLRSAMSEASATSTSVAVRDAQVRRTTGYESVRLTIVPAMSEEARRLFLVVFEDQFAGPVRRGVSPREGTLVRQLEEELQATREDLRATVEGLETSNEELKVANEEVISINEELQSSNEELQSSKEELQSLNEELNTVNQQLQTKVAELEVANNDLRNLLASNDVATLCLDRDLKIKWFSPAARGVLSLLPGDVNRPIGVFGMPLLGETLISDARAVLDRLESIQIEIRVDDDRWYLRRTLPYHTEDKRVDGVIVTFTDITDGKRAANLALEVGKRAAATRERGEEERAEQIRLLAVDVARGDDDERRAIAHDLQRDLARMHSIIRTSLSRLDDGGSVGEFDREIGEVADLITSTAKGVDSLAFQLSPDLLSDRGLITALRRFAEEMKTAYGLGVECSDDGKPKPMSRAVSAILFGAFRELLIDIGRQARVATAQISVRRVDDTLVAKIRHAGAASDSADFRPTSVSKRLTLIGGSAEMFAIPGQGTEVTLSVPLQEQEPATS